MTTFNFKQFGLDIKQAGWCTPTILVVVLGLLGVIALSVQLATNKDKTKTNGLVTSLIIKFLWTIGIGGLLFWMCSAGKLEAAWWTFGLLYLLPIALLFVALAGWFYVTAEQKHDKKMQYVRQMQDQMQDQNQQMQDQNQQMQDQQMQDQNQQMQDQNQQM